MKTLNDIPYELQHDLLIEYNVGEYPRSAGDHKALDIMWRQGYFEFDPTDGYFETTDQGREYFNSLKELVKPIRD